MNRKEMQKYALRNLINTPDFNEALKYALIIGSIKFYPHTVASVKGCTNVANRIHTQILKKSNDSKLKNIMKKLIHSDQFETLFMLCHRETSFDTIHPNF